MSGRAIPNYRQVKVADLVHPCPAAGARTRTRQPRASLDRWKVLRDLLAEAWGSPGTDPADILDRHLSALSRLEADLVRRMFLNVQRIFPLPDGAEVDLEGTALTFDHDGSGISTAVHTTLSLAYPDGTTEHVRLKTGRAASSPEEAAVMWSAAEEGESFTDLMAWVGEVEPVPRPSAVEARLESLIDRASRLDSGEVRPGAACVWCRRAALCGAFPADRVVPTTARIINLTKTDIEVLDRCHRRVAWRRVHAIPRDDGEEEGVAGAAAGRLFHSLVAAVEGSDRPEDTLSDFLLGVPPSEVAEMAMMWDHHRQLMESEGIVARRAEFPVGLTLLEGERADLHGVTIIGFVDLTARDAGGRPVAVELKTGSPGDTTVEDDLYAVGMSRWVDGGPTVIHRHYVRPSPPVCEMVELDPATLEGPRQRLRSRVAPVHEWDWEDPLAVGYSVGPWCGGCEFRTTCESYRS